MKSLGAISFYNPSLSLLFPFFASFLLPFLFHNLPPPFSNFPIFLLRKKAIKKKILTPQRKLVESVIHTWSICIVKKDLKKGANGTFLRLL